MLLQKINTDQYVIENLFYLNLVNQLRLIHNSLRSVFKEAKPCERKPNPVKYMKRKLKTLHDFGKYMYFQFSDDDVR